jgi:hypothetical protein
VSIIEPMVIDMNEAQVRSLEQVRQVRQVLEGPQSLEFRRAEDDEGRYAWIESVLRRLDYRQLTRRFGRFGVKDSGSGLNTVALVLLCHDWTSLSWSKPWHGRRRRWVRVRG